MVAHPFQYQSQNLRSARTALMLPHPEGEARSIARALNACSFAFKDLKAETVKHEQAREWIQTIKGFMDTSGLVDTTGEGLWVEKAKNMSPDERTGLARCIDELATWFDREYWAPDPPTD